MNQIVPHIHKGELVAKSIKQMSTASLNELSDSQLYQLSQWYGSNANTWKRKFAGLLPEVNRRKLYKSLSRQYHSIYEYAKKIGGMTERATDKVINLDKRLEGLPYLRQLLVSGKVGWSKLEKVASIATSETDEQWADRVMNMSQITLEAFVKSLRNQADPIYLEKVAYIEEVKRDLYGEDILIKSENGVYLTLKSQVSDQKPVCKEIYCTTLSFKIDVKTEMRLRVLKSKLERKQKETLSWGECLKIMERLVTQAID